MTGKELDIETAIWPIGKYKGQPVERALADRSYIQWVLAQPWFAERYTQINQLVVNYGAEPQDSPEHNEMQIRFLDDDLCLALATRLGFETLQDHPNCSREIALGKAVKSHLDSKASESLEELRTEKTRFEEGGWDVSFTIRQAAYSLLVEREGMETLLTCLKGVADRNPEHQHLERIQLAVESAERYIEKYDKDKAAADNSYSGYLSFYDRDHCLASVRPAYNNKAEFVRIELKPDLGDDYPAVLRQMKRYPGFGASGVGMVLLVRRAQFSTVSFEQVKAFFKNEGVWLIMEAELDPVPLAPVDPEPVAL